jgi:1-acyl-sn-glycerol-3-phosphate acyltransferase
MNFAPRNWATAMSSIVQVADYSPNYSGNFIASLRAAPAQYRNRGFKQLWVFPEEARDRGWLNELSKGGASIYISSQTLKTIIGRRLPQFLVSRISEDCAVRIFGDHSLLVLAEAQTWVSA